MKQTYLILVCIGLSFNAWSQDPCSEAQSHVFYAFNNTKKSLEANNVTHTKHYAQKALEAFERVESSLKGCDCTNVADLTWQSLQKLKEVPAQEKMHDARYFVGKAKKFAEEIITELDYCTSNTSTPVVETELSSIQEEQQALKAQQEELLRKQQELKEKLAQQEAQEQHLQKEQLIAETQAALDKNIKAYNELLNACNCNKSITSLKSDKEELLDKSLEEIRKHYLNSIKSITSSYMATIDECED